jgi:hypothetical protein
MAKVRVRFGRRSAVLLAGAAAAACGLPLTPLPAAAAPPAAAQPPVAAHRMNCILISGTLYLGDPGSGPNPRNVTCGVHFAQVHPRSDGVVVVLRHGTITSLSSLRRQPPQTPVFGREPLRWLNHPGPARIGCALAGGLLHLGSTGPARPRAKRVCTVRFVQLEPAADGVLAVLSTAHHVTRYTVVMARFPHRPTGRTALPWVR